MSNRWKGGFIQAYFDPLTVGPLIQELYAWGESSFGELGLSDKVDRSSPTQVGSLGTWDKIAA